MLGVRPDDTLFGGRPDHRWSSLFTVIAASSHAAGWSKRRARGRHDRAGSRGAGASEVDIAVDSPCGEQCLLEGVTVEPPVEPATGELVLPNRRRLKKIRGSAGSGL